MEQKSTCDRFIEFMAMLKAISPENDEPARHMMRRNRQLAEQIIDSALRQAFELAWQAQDMPAEAARIIKDAMPTLPVGEELRTAQQSKGEKT